jgi:DNA ligase-1
MFKPPMLAKDFNKVKPIFPLYTEPKFDGMRVLAVVAGGNTIFYSRTGKILPYTSYKGELIELSKGMQFVYDCELMGGDFTETMQQGRRQKNRDESNLILNLFDVIPLRAWLQEETAVYTARKLVLRSLFHDQKFERIKFVDWLGTCNDPEEAQFHHDLCLKRGFEGVMLKRDVPYQWKRSSDLLKLKIRERFIAQVVGFQEGEGKHEGRLGALEVLLGEHVFFVGTGFNDAQREFVWSNQDKYLGESVSILGQELTGAGAIRFPVFDSWEVEDA